MTAAAAAPPLPDAPAPMSPALDRRRAIEGALFLALFCACIPAANWLIQNVGTVCVANGPCLIPVGWKLDGTMLMAPSAVIVVGLAFVLRDLVQRRLGVGWAAGAVVAGAALSALLAPPALVIASGVAFLVAEMADLLVYTPLARRRLIAAVVLSSIAGLVVDSLVFLQLAFGSLEFLWGQVAGKSWAVIAALPFVYWLRERDARIGLQAA
ncbi:MAG: VUT family protein [Hyphomicrobiaceae bacterium]